MKNDVFIAKLAKGAAATALIGSAVMPTNLAHSAPVVNPLVAEHAIVPEPAVLPSAEVQASTGGAFTLTLVQNPSVWDNKLEKEFRVLALAEATGKLSEKDAVRLEQLSLWRDDLVQPQTIGEIQLRLKRDRLLAQMENLLKEYVEFQDEVAYHARKAS
jgi:hypothetical protein